MKRLLMSPDGFPCTLGECPPGFFLWNDSVFLKTEYGDDSEAFCGSGEYFVGGVADAKERKAITVQPLVEVWETFE